MDCFTTKQPFSKSDIGLLVLIPIVGFLADFFVLRNSFVTSSILYKCLVDSTTHFAIAALSWAVINSKRSSHSSRPVIFSSVTCGVLASLVDVDHFVAAGLLDLTVRISC